MHLSAHCFLFLFSTAMTWWLCDEFLLDVLVVFGHTYWRLLHIVRFNFTYNMPASSRFMCPWSRSLTSSWEDRFVSSHLRQLQALQGFLMYGYIYFLCSSVQIETSCFLVSWSIRYLYHSNFTQKRLVLTLTSSLAMILTLMLATELEILMDKNISKLHLVH